MIIIHDPRQFQEATLGWRAEGRRSAFVPTMGALHDGHFRLIEQARRRADRVSVSIFLNPAQFGPSEDLGKYPRTFERDCEGCAARGVDVVFAPTPELMYPEGFQTWVEVERLTRPLCGAARPGHFRGVTTVVLKLLMLAQPDVALFGWKDAQQFLVLRRMARDLAVPVVLDAVDTVREADGLAMSSRNAYLGPGQRAAAPRIYEALRAARTTFEHGEHSAQALLEPLRAHIEASPLLRVEYAELRSLETLEEIETMPAPLANVGDERGERGESREPAALLAVAVRVENGPDAAPVRLIDNIRL